MNADCKNKGTVQGELLTQIRTAPHSCLSLPALGSLSASLAAEMQAGLPVLLKRGLRTTGKNACPTVEVQLEAT